MKRRREEGRRDEKEEGREEEKRGGEPRKRKETMKSNKEGNKDFCTKYIRWEAVTVTRKTYLFLSIESSLP